MKTYLILLVAVAFPFIGIAQKALKTMDGGSYDPKKQRNEVVQEESTGTIYYKSNTTQVQQSIGQTYDADQLTRMPSKDINRIAGTVAGVESRFGEVPNIRNAGPEGTAYFVDGVRAYGALPKLTW